LEQLLNLHEVILLSELNRIVPLVKQHAAVYRAFHVAKLHIGIYGILAQAHGLELFADRLQHRGVWWDLVDQLTKASEVFKFVISVRQPLVVVGKLVILCRLAPFLTLRTVIREVFVGSFEHLVITRSTFNQRHHLRPITQLHPQV